MRIAVFTKYGNLAASTRQRFEQYIPYLRNEGFELEFFPLLENGYISETFSGNRANAFRVARSYLSRIWHLLSKRHYDVIWVQYELFPYLPGIFESFTKLSGISVVFDFDDAIFHQYDSHKKLFVRHFLGKKLAPILRSADLAMCGNAYLANYARQYCTNVEIIPTVVDLLKFQPASNVQTPPDDIGWIGSPSTWNFVKPFLPVFQDVCQSRSSQFRVVGAGAAAKDLAFVNNIQWREMDEISQIQNMRVGVMPLDNSPFARGKCGYKLIQYMACGIPVIASPVGVNQTLVEHGVNGYLAETSTEWRDALERLLSDPQLCLQMGKAGRQKIVEHYSIQVTGPIVARLFLKLIGKTTSTSP